MALTPIRSKRHAARHTFEFLIDREDLSLWDVTRQLIAEVGRALFCLMAGTPHPSGRYMLRLSIIEIPGMNERVMLSQQVLRETIESCGEILKITDKNEKATECAGCDATEHSCDKEKITTG